MSENKVKKLIMDVDTGSDDAVALMLAILHENVDLMAVCTVGGGNLPLANTTENTLRVLQAFGCDAPVYPGCQGAMVKHIAGDRLVPPPWNPVAPDGTPLPMHVPYLDLPASTRPAEDMHAASFYVDYLRKATEPVTIVATGPMTNLGVAIAMDPDVFKRNVEQIVVMGGAHQYANATPASEANVWNDPEAAQLVAHCGAKVVFIPLDATHKAVVTGDDCKRMRALGNLAGSFAADVIEYRIRVTDVDAPLHIPNCTPVHDALAVAYVIDPEVCMDVRHVNLNVGLRDFAEGRTVVDTRYHDDERNCWFAFVGDRFKFADMLCHAFANFK